MSLQFVAGHAGDVYPAEIASSLGVELTTRFGINAARSDPYESEPLDPAGWRLLQQKVLKTLDLAPQLTSIDAYQSVYLPHGNGVEHLQVANLADPFQLGSVPALIEELTRFAAASGLPTDDLELMRLAAHYLEADDPDEDLDVQTFVQLLLTARQALARSVPLWIAV